MTTFYYIPNSMHTAIQLRSDELSPDIIEGIKSLFLNKTILIQISEVENITEGEFKEGMNESSAFLLNNTTNRAVLLDRIERFERGESIPVSFSEAELERYA
jgi:hypothetical protein